MNYTNKEASLFTSKARWSGRIYATFAVAVVSLLGSALQAQSSVTGNSAPKNTVITTVTVGSEPFGLVVSPDNKFVYVANFDDDSISVIDTATNKVKTVISSVPRPFEVVINSAGSKLYVTNDVDPGTVTVIDLSKGNSKKTITGFGSAPSGLALTPDGTQLWVTNSGGNTVAIVDTRTDAIISSIVVGARPSSISFTPNGKKAYVTAGHKVSVIDTASKAVTTTILVGHKPVGLAVTPTGDAVYVEVLHPYKDNSTVDVIDTATDTLTKVIHFSGLGYPGNNLAILPDGKYVYYPLSEIGGVILIDTATNARVRGFGCGQPDSVAIAPNGKRAYVSDTLDDIVTVVGITE